LIACIAGFCASLSFSIASRRGAKSVEALLQRSIAHDGLLRKKDSDTRVGASTSDARIGNSAFFSWLPATCSKILDAAVALSAGRDALTSLP
jgi:hypothetical protein